MSEAKQTGNVTISSQGKPHEDDTESLRAALIGRRIRDLDVLQLGGSTRVLVYLDDGLTMEVSAYADGYTVEDWGLVFQRMTIADLAERSTGTPGTGPDGEPKEVRDQGTVRNAVCQCGAANLAESDTLLQLGWYYAEGSDCWFCPQCVMQGRVTIVQDRTIPRGRVELRHPTTGELLGAIENVGTGEDES